MPLRPSRPSNPATLLATACLAAVGLTAGCGVPPELQPKPGSSIPRPTATTAPPSLPPSFSPPPAVPPSVQPSAAGFPEAAPVDCAGKPTGDQVIAAVRAKSSVLPQNTTVTVSKAPTCAGTWQYTVVTVSGREPLQIVTKGAPAALSLVTAGTDICTVEVRNFAPPGIRIAAGC